MRYAILPVDPGSVFTRFLSWSKHGLTWATGSLKRHGMKQLPTSGYGPKQLLKVSWQDVNGGIGGTHSYYCLRSLKYPGFS